MVGVVVAEVRNDRLLAEPGGFEEVRCSVG
jgi:hypothetical protein